LGEIFLFQARPIVTSNGHTAVELKPSEIVHAAP
jgi:hypothetical protein